MSDQGAGAQAKKVFYNRVRRTCLKHGIDIVYDGMLAGVGNFYDFMKDAFEEEEIQYWESREAERLKEVIQ